MRMGLTGLAVTLACSVAAGSAVANDATAVLGAGGLRLVYNSAIELRSEDLRVSADEIHVRYHFHNITADEVTVTVAFPLPPLDAEDHGEMMVALPDPADPNFLDFALVVDGKPLEPTLYTRVSALGVDRTEMLTAYGVPLNPAGEETYEALARLSPSVLDSFRRAGLVMVEDWGVLPVWRTETAFYWEQTFPPGEDVVVEHTYTPVVGYGFFGEYTLTDPDYIARYCMDDDFIAAATAMLGRQGADFQLLNERRIEYILTTANTWASPIQDFRLTVDKGSPNALISFCGNGVTRDGETTFVDTETNYVPERELDILIIEPVTQ